MLEQMMGPEKAAQMMEVAKSTPSPEVGSYDQKGRYQFEVPFRREMMADIPEESQGKLSLSRFIKDPRITEALKGFMGMPVSVLHSKDATGNSAFGSTGPGIDQQYIKLSGRDMGELHQSLSHELEHAIQKQEAPGWSSGFIDGLENLQSGEIGNQGFIQKKDFPYVGGLMARLSTADPKQQTKMNPIELNALDKMVSKEGYAFDVGKLFKYLGQQNEAQARLASFRDSSMSAEEQKNSLPMNLMAIPEETQWLRKR